MICGADGVLRGLVLYTNCDRGVLCSRKVTRFHGTRVYVITFTPVKYGLPSARFHESYECSLALGAHGNLDLRSNGQ